ncbi:hypothetical protein, variant [Aphanomyces invadans]|uniref:UDENN domain-containing protein n=1 Tax=Aphanomyces invadans TaxID=157072 RepID=A0A024URB0_9STRA|nr:hypothetical protein, variant [Aphanomyces invadans]ETW08956.1 hypothetical protein, variant [Aphanomyces invadans]|eukprot:XP_008862761.1 hypothetical protein, variant [Aphanomyces invadans]
MIASEVLYAEFDIDKGSTLRASFPTAPDELDKTVLRTPEFFADMMLPEGVHNREQDYTVFFIHKDSTVKYCLSVVKTLHDATVRRGARVKAVAICSDHHFCIAFKDILTIAIDKLFALGSNESAASATDVLQSLYDVINAVDVSGVTNLQQSEVEVRLLKRTMCAKPLGGAVHTSDESLVYTTHASWGNESIPLKIKLCNTQDQHEEGSLIDLIAKFGDQTMQIYNAVLTGSRIIMLGYGLPAGKVCNYVLSTSALLCPPLLGLIHRQHPYANLTDLAFLSVPGYIAGVTNPMFKGRKEWWDVHCDLATGEILASVPPEKDDAESIDHDFIAEVMDGIEAGFSESWVRCMFEEYTRQNIVDIAMGEASFVDQDAQGKRTALNNKRITKWARTENFERYVKARDQALPTTPAFDAKARGTDLKRHLRTLMHEKVPDDAQVERIYVDFVTLLNTEDEFKELLSYIPRSKGTS